MSRTKKWAAAITAGALAATVGALTTPWTALADQVILDDLIVDGSACVGQDCVNGESFGFDTIRIKENNLRIKAQDTSSTASFPTQDWQITFNDSTNGGQNKFSIDAIAPSTGTPFTIEASNQNHALYVDDGGRIGLGTNNPVTEIHIKDGDTPTVRFEQDGSSGFTPQTWDVASNETNFFVRDATNGSTLPFRIRPGAPTSAIDVAANGDVGFGTTSPGGSIDVTRTSGAASFRIDSVEGAAKFVVKDDGTEFLINHTADTTSEMRIHDHGTIELRSFATPPTATPKIGEIYVDTSGAFCVALAANVWTNVGGAGSCA